MINKAKRVAKKVLRGDNSEKKIQERFKSLTQNRAPHHAKVTHGKVDEALFYINKVKNSTTVATGPYEALTRIFTGQKMYVDTRDISVAPHLMLEGEWEIEITHVFRNLIQQGDTVFDIGANFGYFGLIAGTEIGKNGKVFFIEANEALIPYIRKTMSVNGLNESGRILNVALAAKEGSVELQVLEDYWGSSSVNDLESLAKSNQHLDLHIAKKQKIRAASLDTLCKENSVESIDVIKLDIEGYEETAYQGMKSIIKNSPRLKMLIEFTAAGYKSPENFFKQIQNDFPYVYAIEHEDGSVVQVNNYSEVSEKANGDWIMLIASKELVTGI